MHGQTSKQKRPGTCAIMGRRCGGGNASAAGRRGKSMKLTPPIQTLAALKCRKFIKVCMASISGKNIGEEVALWSLPPPDANEYDPIDEPWGFLRIMSGFAECACCNLGVTDGVDNDKSVRKRTS
jgi:hypothetical protein